MLTVAAVTPTNAGNAMVYPYGTAQPAAASLQYSAGAIVSSAVLAQIPNPLFSFDFTIYTQFQANYIVDITGYFAPPVATALQCVDTASTILNNILPGGIETVTAPACPTGYT